MSTNAVIQVEGNDCIVYKHWDGYPSATLPFLREFHKRFLKNRGYDPTYETAQLLRATMTMGPDFELDPSEFTGWGVYAGTVEDTDVPYAYVLHSDGSVSVNDHKYLPDEVVIFAEDE